MPESDRNTDRPSIVTKPVVVIGDSPRIGLRQPTEIQLFSEQTNKESENEGPAILDELTRFRLV